MYRENLSKLQSTEEIELFEKIKAETSPRMKLRYDIILLHMEGYTNKAISKIYHLAPCTVGKYVHSYETQGVEGLAIHKGQGVKSKMTLEQEKRLYECITTKYPAEVGFAPHMNWTAPLACQWLETEEGIHYSARGMRNVFKRLKLSYTRPTYTLKKANLEKQAAFQEEFVSLKKFDFWGH